MWVKKGQHERYLWWWDSTVLSLSWWTHKPTYAVKLQRTKHTDMQRDRSEMGETQYGHELDQWQYTENDKVLLFWEILQLGKMDNWCRRVPCTLSFMIFFCFCKIYFFILNHHSWVHWLLFFISTAQINIFIHLSYVTVAGSFCNNPSENRSIKGLKSILFKKHH
jgi:hypothetical protein